MSQRPTEELVANRLCRYWLYRSLLYNPRCTSIPIASHLKEGRIIQHPEEFWEIIPHFLVHGAHQADLPHGPGSVRTVAVRLPHLQRAQGERNITFTKCYYNYEATSTLAGLQFRHLLFSRYGV